MRTAQHQSKHDSQTGNMNTQTHHHQRNAEKEPLMAKVDLSKRHVSLNCKVFASGTKRSLHQCVQFFSFKSVAVS